MLKGGVLTTMAAAATARIPATTFDILCHTHTDFMLMEI
jgi:hypothetical protein